MLPEEWVPDNDDDCGDVRVWGLGGGEVDGWGSFCPHCPGTTHWRRAGGDDATAQTAQGTVPLFFLFLLKQVWKQSVRGKGLSEVLWKSHQTHIVPALSFSLHVSMPFLLCVCDYSPDSRK